MRLPAASPAVGAGRTGPRGLFGERWSEFPLRDLDSAAFQIGQGNRDGGIPALQKQCISGHCFPDRNGESPSGIHTVFIADRRDGLQKPGLMIQYRIGEHNPSFLFLKICPEQFFFSLRTCPEQDRKISFSATIVQSPDSLQ